MKSISSMKMGLAKGFLSTHALTEANQKWSALKNLVEKIIYTLIDSVLIKVIYLP